MAAETTPPIRGLVEQILEGGRVAFSRQAVRCESQLRAATRVSLIGIRPPRPGLLRRYSLAVKGQFTSIRPAELGDAAAIARVHIRTWQVAYRGQLPDAFLDALNGEIDQRTSRWQGWIADATSHSSVHLVAQEGDRVVGFVSFGPSGDEPVDPRIGEVYAIYVDPSYWDRGYGRALFTAAVRRLTEVGFSEATLWVLDTNIRARRFYEIAGWVADGAVKMEHRADIELREVRYRRAQLKEGAAQS